MIKNLLLLLTFLSLTSYAQVRILLTAALTEAHFEMRKAQYINMFHKLAHYGYANPYVVEALKKEGPTFLDEYSSNVFYATADIAGLTNKGVNEALTTLQSIIFFNFLPEDMIIRMSGRYDLLSDHFLKIVKQEQDHFDAFVRITPEGAVHTAGFAMRCKYLKEMLSKMELAKMETHSINIEAAVGEYITRKACEGNFRVYYVAQINLLGNSFGSSTMPGAPEHIVLH